MFKKSYFTGDLRLWVYIDTKSSGNCVCVVAKPTMTALEMTQQVLREKRLQQDECGLVLHEAILGEKSLFFDRKSLLERSSYQN